MSLHGSLRDLVKRPVTAEEPTLGLRLGLGALGLAALGYGVTMRARNFAYAGGLLPIHRLPCRVVCVGNLTVGGTGKTPTVVTVARRLLAAGQKVCVLIRGYGREGTATEVVSDGRDLLLDWQQAGDEAMLLGRLLPGVPVVVGGDRVESGRLALRWFGPDTLLLDDGFQHRRLHRDVDIVLLDASDPLGGGKLLPRGRLREPVGALRRAHAILLTRSDQAGDLAALRRGLEEWAPGVPVVCAVHQACRVVDLRSGQVMPPAALRGRKIMAMSGIANPEAFHRTLRQLDARLTNTLVFTDHHPFSREDRRHMEREARSVGAECIVTTEKDAVRLGQELPTDPPILALGIDVRVVEGEGTLDRLLGIAVTPRGVTAGEAGRG